MCAEPAARSAECNISLSAAQALHHHCLKHDGRPFCNMHILMLMPPGSQSHSNGTSPVSTVPILLLALLLALAQPCAPARPDKRVTAPMRHQNDKKRHGRDHLYIKPEKHWPSTCTPGAFLKPSVVSTCSEMLKLYLACNHDSLPESLLWWPEDEKSGGAETGFAFICTTCAHASDVLLVDFQEVSDRHTIDVLPYPQLSSAGTQDLLQHAQAASLSLSSWLTG